MGEGVGYCAVMSHESLGTVEGRAGELADGVVSKAGQGNAEWMCEMCHEHHDDERATRQSLRPKKRAGSDVHA